MKLYHLHNLREAIFIEEFVNYENKTVVVLVHIFFMLKCAIFIAIELIPVLKNVNSRYKRNGNQKMPYFSCSTKNNLTEETENQTKR